ncbi:hypothetical protein EGP91_05215 [bacterium]|nr:hypothetical protein [bacterium]
MNSKKTTIIISIIILLVLSVAIGISYAYWVLNLNQDSKNIVSTKCLNVTFTEGDAINLQKTYPMEDEEGKKLTPYTFNLKNECNDKANYQINLETLTDSTLDINYVKVKLNDDINILGDKEAVTKTLDNAIDSRMLETGILNANETKTFNLNVWLSYDAPNDTMNKTFESKITVTTSYHATLGTEKIKDLVAKADTSTTDVYTVPEKTSDSCTYTLAYDGTADNNLRYVGSNPCNYVKVDGELWRIIGVMNNIDDGTGKKESRIKLIRDKTIGNYAWDTSIETINYGNGVNEWSQADLMKLLNPGYENETAGGSLYYNNGTGNCYSSINNELTSCDFTSSGLKSNLKALIGDVLWHTGANGIKDSSNLYEGLSNQFYSYERSTNNGKICSSESWCNDTITRITFWTGKVGLIYPSDYGYATSGGTGVNRTNCLNQQMYDWNNSSNDDCKTNDWLYNSSLWQWVITPSTHSTNAVSVFAIFGEGHIGYTYARDQYAVRPSVYLLSTVKITQGEGTLENPYVLGK